MRPIEFRCWDLEEKCFLDDDYFFIDYKGTVYLNGGYERPYEISNENVILQQFTGLYDKNEAKIFEDDILLLDEEWIKLIEARRKHVLVGFSEGAFMYGRGIDLYDLNSYLWIGSISKYITVIGNIHQNPELLETEIRRNHNSSI